MKPARIFLITLCVTLLGNFCLGEDPKPQENSQPYSQTVSRGKLHERFEKMMSGVKLVGRFTILGKDDGPMPKEEYTINSVTKLPDGDLWLFNARIKYGERDLTVPLPLEVKWAGDTPVITLTDFTIPGMGTFSSRVVIDNQKYAGTWSHGKAGGHLFGLIEKAVAKEPDLPAP